MIERALRACVSPRVWGTLALAALLQSTANVSTAQAFPERGIASITWLPGKTACGGRFNPKAMAAAHKTLRCGTKVLVRHSGNNKSVVVTITDRGPYRRGRIIDLTPAAAAAIGMSVRAGLANVSIHKPDSVAATVKPVVYTPHVLATVHVKSDLVYGYADNVVLMQDDITKALVSLREIDARDAASRLVRARHATLFAVGVRKKVVERRLGWPRVLPGTAEKAVANIKPEPMSVADGAAVLRRADDDEYLCDVYKRQPVKADRSGDFTWKDLFAAKRLGKSVCDYVIGGMAPKFKAALAAAGREMDRRGIRWSILSGFRDDYRQRIAAGFKARTGNSLHGGSRVTCGYGCGRAVDISDGPGGGITIASGWIAKHGHKWGLRRPMPRIDPAHVQMGGSRYAKRWKVKHRWGHRRAYRVAAR